MNVVELPTSSRNSSSSPGGSPSRSSTPSQSSASSDFLPSDTAPLTPWTPYAKPDMTSLYDEDRKPNFDSFYTLGIAGPAQFQSSPPRGMMLEDLMQEDSYETGTYEHLLAQTKPDAPTLITSFDPTLPQLPTYPSPPSASSSEGPSQPASVHVVPARETVRLPARAQSSNPSAESSSAFYDSSAVQNLLVTAPNATCPSTSVQNPSRNSVGNLPILIHNVPATGAKSRVETQIKMTLDLAAPRDGMSAYDRIGSWKWLRLPKGTSTRRRPRKEPKIDAHPEDTLTLSVSVTCASDPSMPVAACTNCMQREAKRIERKKAARVRPQRHDSSDSEDEGAVFRLATGPDGKPVPGARDGGDGTTGIVVFNCPEVNDFSEGRAVLPVRVTCYCRHHREKIGFRIAFTMSDSQGRIVGRGSTPPIMITDDHKSVVKAPAAVEEEEPPQVAPSSGPKRNKRRAKDADAETTEREPRAKRRAKEAPSSNASTASTPQPSGASFFSPQFSQRFDANSPRLANTSAHASQSPSTFTTAPSSPILSALSAPSPAPSAVYLHYPVTNDVQSPQPALPSAPITIDPYIPPEELDAISSSLAAAAAASPSMMPDLTQPASTAAASIFSALALGTGASDPSYATPPPQIHRLIPASGPTHGGIEITVLGANFLPTHRCVFGDTVATSTQMWSDSTLLCVLPPSATPGPVVVSFEGVPLAVGGGGGAGGADGRGLQLFNYLDNSDRALMELALQVVGLKMTGRIEDAKDVAMRIVGPSSNDNGSDAGMTSSGMSFSSNGLSMDEDIVHSALHGSDSSASTRDFQSVIIEFLKLLDVDVPTTSRVTIPEAVSLSSTSGQTLLHLSAILGFHRLLKHLITRGIDLDVRDANGYTALHFAALCGRVACARILVEGGADIEIVDGRGKVAREIAQWRDQVDVQELLEGYERMAESRFESEDADESELEDIEEATEDEEAEADEEEEEEEWDVASPTATIKPTPHDIPEELSLSDSEFDFPADDKTPSPPSEKSLLEKALFSGSFTSPPSSASEKNPQSLFHRTLSQLPTPNLPALPPMPDFFPAMPAQWAALHLPEINMPQLQIPPLVFPVQLPAPSWPAAFQWAGTSGEPAQGEDGEKTTRQYPPPPPSPSSWMSLYTAWLANVANPGQAQAQAQEKTQEQQERDSSPPPMYTPSPSASQAHLSSSSVPSTSTSTSVLEDPPVPTLSAMSSDTGVTSGSTTPTARSAVKKLTRRQAHAAEREREHRSNAALLKKKSMQQQQQVQVQSKQRSKSDRMLVFFWIPILIVVLLYGFYVGVPALITGARNARMAYSNLRKQLTA